MTYPWNPILVRFRLNFSIFSPLSQMAFILGVLLRISDTSVPIWMLLLGVYTVYPEIMNGHIFDEDEVENMTMHSFMVNSIYSI